MRLNEHVRLACGRRLSSTDADPLHPAPQQRACTSTRALSVQRPHRRPHWMDTSPWLSFTSLNGKKGEVLPAIPVTSTCHFSRCFYLPPSLLLSAPSLMEGLRPPFDSCNRARARCGSRLTSGDLDTGGLTLSGDGTRSPRFRLQVSGSSFCQGRSSVR